ncbi:protein misato homolog 1 isoform X2 [Macadamia integrifolia]|uniref:protein misato homolog 1 isoform X2 n=1 Tax=Macadamia integrifolia TaxID=60698 RepID=UPI001C4FE625|nr:protein misato homolog 1 isoform X2 [Macadamia integrifolia]
MKEIVTVQLGGFANFIGSHFWNFQDELLGLAGDPHADPVYKNKSLDMDVFYRAGETPQGILTYTPRLVLVDFQGSLGSLSSGGSLYSEIPSDPVVTWTGSVSRHVSEPRKKNLFLQSLYEEEQETPSMPRNDEDDEHQSEMQDKDIVECLENNVQYWTDFSKVHYHPRSLYELNGLWMDVQEFNNYGIGRNVFSEGSRGEEMNEQLRFFMEECDHIQGIQFIVDDSGGFSSVASDFLENIADEYTRTPVLLYAARGPGTYMNNTSRKESISRALHDAVSFSRLSSFCNLIVPVGLPFLSQMSNFLCIDDSKPYHCSAVYAAALHSMSLPFRMEQLGPSEILDDVSGAVDVNGVIQMLAGQARENMVAILDAAMPAPPLTGEQKKQSLQKSLRSLTPEVAEDVEDVQAVEHLTIHGALRSGASRTTISEVQVSFYAGYQNSSTRPRFSHISVAHCPLPIPLPFPSIFGNLVGQHGELLGNPVTGSRRGSLDVHSIPMAARLRSSTAILPYIEKRSVNLRRFGIDRGTSGSELARSWGFGKDELEDMGEGYSKIITALDPHSAVSSDSE